MDHRYIDDHSIAERYLDHALAAGDRREFERHLVDCQECTDRILLAGMFHTQMTNGNRPPGLVKPRQPGLVVRLRPRQILLILLISLLLISSVPLLVWLLVRGLGR